MSIWIRPPSRVGSPEPLHERATSHLTRAQLLSAAGSLVLSADADLAKVAATAELLAIDFYEHALASRHFKDDERAHLAAARDNEIEHQARWGSFKSKALKSLAGKIAATESRHLGVLTNIAAGAIVPAPDLPRIYTGVQALAALKLFLA